MNKREYTNKQIAVIVVLSLAMIVLAVILNHVHPLEKNAGEKTADDGTAAALNAASGEAETGTLDTPAPTPTADPTEQIATFLQGPKSWKARRVWSGEWGDAYYDGGSFGGFGCGLCCMANLYTSLTEYECSPLDMYQYAKKVSGYDGGGAIDWGYIKETLASAGISGDVGKKPSDYETFQKKVKEAEAVIAVISSQDSTCYWKDTPGHYVTLFLYNEETDKVFLADSGDPDHNRHWVSLKKIYRSLKTANTWQFFAVSGCDEKKDTWKHSGFGGTVILPDGWS